MKASLCNNKLHKIIVITIEQKQKVTSKEIEDIILDMKILTEASYI